MKTENLSTLKIHKLTQAQYDRELAAGNISENEWYLTPDEEVKVPTKLSQLENDTGFITLNDIPAMCTLETLEVPTKTSQLENDSGFTNTDYVDQEIENCEIALAEQINGLIGRIDEMENAVSVMTIEIVELNTMLEEVLV